MVGSQVAFVIVLVLLAAALVAALAIAHRQRAARGTANDQGLLAGELIELEEELNYAEALHADNPRAAANLARAHTELNTAFSIYNSRSSSESFSTSDANGVQARVAIVRDILANPHAPVSGVGNATVSPVLVNTQLSPAVSTESRIYEVALWILGIIPGIVLALQKSKARLYFASLDQRIKTNATQIDAYLNRRAQLLRDCPGFTADIDPEIAGNGIIEDSFNISNGRIDRAYQTLVERTQSQYGGEIPPELHKTLHSDRKIQREIAAARTLYNDTVNMWNTDIFAWPAKQMIASQERLTTRPVFVGSRLDQAQISSFSTNSTAALDQIRMR